MLDDEDTENTETLAESWLWWFSFNCLSSVSGRHDQSPPYVGEEIIALFLGIPWYRLSTERGHALFAGIKTGENRKRPAERIVCPTVVLAQSSAEQTACARCR